MKNLLLLSAMFLTCSAVFSQLYVRPNGTADSYIYVNDEVLFVEQGVNLVINPNNPNTEASIYLREQAQLIQGTTATPNTGTGLLSVIQNSPDDDSWDYSFWGSPVGNPSGSGNQNFGILKINDSITETNSNVTQTTGAFNGVESPLTISRRWLYRFPAGGPWTSIGTGNNVPAGYGFIMKGVGTTNHSQKYDFRGRPNNGDMTVAVLANMETLSGNPYPSALDLNRMFYDTDASDPDGTMNTGNQEIDSFRFWDENRNINSHYYVDNQGGYGVWVPMGSNPNTTNPGVYTVAPFLHYDSAGNPTGGQTGSGLSYERRFAPIGQGFMIYGASSGNITIKNQYRKYVVEGAANDSQYRGPLDGDSRDPSSTISGSDPGIQIPYIRIYTQFADSHFRDMVLAFSEQSTDFYDRGFDALHPMDATSDVYFPIGVDNETEKYVIQTVPFDLGKRIPFALNLDQQFDKISIKAVEENNIQNAAYLWDSTDNSYQKITGGQEAQLSLPAGVYENRFYIVFRGQYEAIEYSEGTLAEDAIRGSVDFFQNNPVKQLEVSNPERYDIKSAQIFDMSGKLVLNESNIGTQSKFKFSTANLSDGVYLVKLTTVENVDIDYKMVIYN